MEDGTQVHELSGKSGEEVRGICLRGKSGPGLMEREEEIWGEVYEN